MSIHPISLDMVENAPVSAKMILKRAFEGKASPRAAIKAQCLSCVGYSRQEVTDCTSRTCPLWAYRPYQVKGEE